MNIKLGNRYRDAVTGFEGIATERCHHINGCIQILLEPRSTEKHKRADANWLDYQRLVHVDDGIGTYDTTLPVDLLGVKVEDLVSGITGIVVGVMVDLDGGVEYGVKPPVDEKGKLPDSIWLPRRRIARLPEQVTLPKRDGGADTMDDQPPVR